MTDLDLTDFDFPSYRNEIVLTSVIIILTGFLVAGQATSQDSTDGKDEKVKIVASELVGFEPMLYAISHRKVPEPEGIDIELETASMTMAELHTRSADEPVVGILSNIRVGKAYNSGKEFEIMAPWYREGMGANNMTVGQLVTARDSNITEPEDLEGRKVGLQGLAGGSATAAMTALRLEGVNLSKVEFVGVSEDTGPLLVKNNEIAAAQVDSSIIVSEDFNNSYRTAIDFGKVLHEEYGAVPPSQFVVVREEYYNQNPEKYEKTVQWLRDNYEWARNNKEEISRFRSKETGTDFDLLMKKFSYFERIGNLTEKDIAVLEAYYTTAEQRGTIEKVPDLDAVFGDAVEKDY